MKTTLTYEKWFDIIFYAMRKAELDYLEYEFECDRDLAKLCKNLIEQLNEANAKFFTISEDDPF